MRLAFPFHIDDSGRSAEVDEATYVRSLIELLILTDPGERVMRPDLGGRTQAMVFAPVTDELMGTTQALLQGNLERWLSSLAEIGDVEVRREESVVTVRVAYRIRSTGQTDEVLVTGGT
ncbi:MAG: GPW/gp25 family protein [Myxococcota bacterium]